MSRNYTSVLILLLVAIPTNAAPPGSSFLYQGYLTQAGLPVAGLHDFQFSVFDALSGGIQIGSTVTSESVDIQEGLFNVELDFGNDIFTNRALWIEVSVRASRGGAFTALSPRQPLHLFALNGKSAPLQTSLTGSVTVPPGTTIVTGVGTQFTVEIRVGDPILIADELHTVASVSSDFELSLDTAHTNGALDETAITDGSFFRVQAGNDTDKFIVGRDGVRVGDNGTSISRIEHGTIGDCSPNNLPSAGTNNFSTAFVSPPRVLLTPEDSGGNCKSATISSVTASSFSWRTYNGTSLEPCRCIHWVAFGL